MKELEKRIEVAEATFAWLEASKAEKPNKVVEDVPEKTTGAITRHKQAGKEYQCRDGRTMLMLCIIGAAWTMPTSTAILTESFKYPSTGASRMMNKKAHLLRTVEVMLEKIMKTLSNASCKAIKPKGGPW